MSWRRRIGRGWIGWCYGRRSTVLANARLVRVANTATKETEKAGVARAVGERRERAVAAHALVARALVVVVAVGVVVQVGALALPTHERARVSKRQPTILVFCARHGGSGAAAAAAAAAVAIGVDASRDKHQHKQRYDCESHLANTRPTNRYYEHWRV